MRQASLTGLFMMTSAMLSLGIAMISSLSPTTTKVIALLRLSTALALTAVPELTFKWISIGAVVATNLLGVTWRYLYVVQSIARTAGNVALPRWGAAAGAVYRMQLPLFRRMSGSTFESTAGHLSRLDDPLGHPASTVNRAHPQPLLAQR